MEYTDIVFNGINGQDKNQNFLSILNQNVKNLYSRMLEIDDLSSLKKNILPDATDSRDLGSEDKKFQDIYVLNGRFSRLILENGALQSPSLYFANNTGIFSPSAGIISFVTNEYVPLTLESGRVIISAAVNSQMHIENTLDGSSFTLGCDLDGVKIADQSGLLLQITANKIVGKAPYLADATTGFRFSLEKKMGLTIDSNENLELSNETVSLKLNKNKIEFRSGITLVGQKLTGDGEAGTILVESIPLLCIEGSASIKSLSGGVEGTILKVVKTKRNTTVTIINESTDAGVAQRISTKDGANLVWGNGYNSCDLLFTDGQWVQIN